MPEDTLFQLGVGGALALLILREVFGYLKDRKKENTHISIVCPNKVANLATTLLSLEDKVNRLGPIMVETHQWHKPNSDGIQNWKWSPALEEKFKRLLDTTERMAQLLERLTDKSEHQDNSLRTMTAALQKAIDRS